MSRADLVRVANMDFSGMQINPGLGEYPFTEDCEPFGNAGQSTNVPPRPAEVRADPKTANTYSSQWGYTRPDRRVITGGPTSPWTSELAEMFRIEKGKIHRIEAILRQSPYGQQSGWSTYEESMSDKARDIR